MSVTGKWAVVIRTPVGEQNVVFDLLSEGDVLSGFIKGPDETNPISDGNVQGNLLTWRSKVSRPVPMNLKFAATISDDTIEGSAKGLFGSASFVGRRT
jgi:hypothetical protein